MSLKASSLASLVAAAALAASAAASCSPEPSAFPWAGENIAEGNNFTVALGVGQKLSLGCVQGNVSGLFVGSPAFSVLAQTRESGVVAVLLSSADLAALANGVDLDRSLSAPSGTGESWELQFQNLEALASLGFSLRWSLSLDGVPVAPDSPDACLAGCVPDPGNATTADCGWYSGAGQEWLPWPYGQAATCACQLQGISDPGPSASCVRSYLLAAHQGTSLFNATEKSALAALKAQECARGASNHTCSAQYWSTIVTDVAPRVYGVHKAAYAHCCCPGQPAPFWAWEVVLTFDFGILPSGWCALGLESLAIEAFGACGCDGW